MLLSQRAKAASQSGMVLRSMKFSCLFVTNNVFMNSVWVNNCLLQQIFFKTIGKKIDWWVK